MEREKQGILVSWNQIRGFGVVVVSRTENYFLHTRSIVEGPEVPARGSVVYFDVAPPFNNGKLPNAVNAIILVDRKSVV
jgi:hypothetical protein